MSIKTGSIRNWASTSRVIRSVSGVSLIELTVSWLLLAVVLTVIQLFLLGSFQSLASVSTGEQLHTEFLALQDQLARDIQHAAAVVDLVSLDGQTYQTETGPEADALILRLPAVDSNGVTLPDRYDVIVYTVQQTQGRPPWLSRQLFVNRDVQGNLLTTGQGSARLSETRPFVGEVLRPSQLAGIAPLFAFDRPVLAVAREVVLSVTFQATESAFTRRTFRQTYTARFRLRNT